jgi:hypothetical protein
MPNHITTEVEISAPKKKIDALIKKTKIVLDVDVEDNQFDFNGIVQMPDGLEGTASPVDVVDTQEEADAKNKEWNEQYGNSLQGTHQKYISKTEHERRIKEYGATNWYDWSYENWGTKWNAYEVKFTAHEDEKLVLSVNTAWDTPRAIWNALTEQGYTVKGVMYGEMDGYEFIGDGSDVFETYQSVEVEYIG